MAVDVKTQASVLLKNSCDDPQYSEFEPSRQQSANRWASAGGY